MVRRRNRSNCIFVYNRSKKGLWHTRIIPDLVKTYSQDLDRESLITVAGLGLAHEVIDVSHAINDVLRATKLDHLDLAIIECNAASFSEAKRMASAIESLETMAEQGHILGYGVHVVIPPYMYHTPVKKSMQDMALVPAMFEQSMQARRHCQLILYNISPSHNVPATYPMLEPSNRSQWAKDGEVDIFPLHYLSF
jgi:hypothetical protein